VLFFGAVFAEKGRWVENKKKRTNILTINNHPFIRFGFLVKYISNIEVKID